jgi:hypothetical protein
LANALTVFLILLTIATANASEYYVSADGDDSAEGSADAPFATLTRARDVVRDAKADGGIAAGDVTIWLCGGLYLLEESLSLDQRDSGALDNPVAFRAVEGEEVRIMGGRPLPAAAWRPVNY